MPALASALPNWHFNPLMARYGIAGMAVGVAWNGQAHIFNFGLASKESGQPVTCSMLFEIGSLSKTLTVTLAAFALWKGLVAKGL